MKGLRFSGKIKAPGVSKRSGLPKVKGNVKSGYLGKSLRKNLKILRGTAK